MRCFLLAACLTSVVSSPVASAQSLAGTGSLVESVDLSAAMVEGIDRFVSRLIESSRNGRQPRRERLREILGVVDARVPVGALDWVGSSASPALLLETDRVWVWRVRWPVFEGVSGEGVHIQPKSAPKARVICVPDAGEAPESTLDGALLSGECEILIPAILSRVSEFSGSERLGIYTNQPHREWIYRQAFEMGRHVIGYEVQKILSLVDWVQTLPGALPCLVAGRGEGGLLALNVAALDARVDGAAVAGYFAPREGLWREPIYRNVFGLLRDFGDAEVASLVAPRPLMILPEGYPEVKGPWSKLPGRRGGAAPGVLDVPSLESVRAEVERARSLVPGDWIRLHSGGAALSQLLEALSQRFGFPAGVQTANPRTSGGDLLADSSREKRQVRELEAFTQSLVVQMEVGRDAGFWGALPRETGPALEAALASERERFWNEFIGRLPDPDVPVRPRSRLVRASEKVEVHEVTLDVWKDVFAWGWLCVPKGRRAGERLPVVVCQHGLEGVPADTVEEDSNTRAWKAYKAYALRLAEQGYVTFAPHNPYRGGDAFRVLQRKLNPLGLSLFSVIAGQHQRLLEWLGGLEFVDAARIGFYGLSYGGKSAMRLPAVLPGYALSVCSGDFNEWIRKCVSTDLPASYLYTGEYEIWEWNLAARFNYAEMAALLAPRPFMVERGHNDGVGRDEWVNYEFAKVRRFYNKLGLGERVEIEHFDGPHTIHAEGTFSFLRKHLALPK